MPLRRTSSVGIEGWQPQVRRIVQRPRLGTRGQLRAPWHDPAAAETREEEPEAPLKKLALPGVKEQVSLRIDQDVLEYFREGGAGWQDRINDALRKAAGK